MVKNPPANAGDSGSIPGSGRSPGEENGSPLKHSCLGNPMDRVPFSKGLIINLNKSQIDPLWETKNTLFPVSLA